MFLSLSKVPFGFEKTLKDYTANGYRVIALAGKSLPSSVSWFTASNKYTRDQIESDLDFYGLLIMQNAMKPETSGIIAELAEAGIRTVMVTGDNLLTALCVARQCGIIPNANQAIIVDAEEENNNDVNNENQSKPNVKWTLADEPVDLENINLSLVCFIFFYSK